MDRRTFIGVDPGVNGGIAALRAGEVIAVAKNDDGWTLKDFVLRVAPTGWHHRINPDPLRVAIEAVPKWCGAERFAIHAMTGSAMATMYGSFQLAVGVCIGMGIKPTLLVPVKWQNLVECRNRERLETTAWKNKLKERARTLYPGFEKLTLWNCDAILVAHALTLVE